MMMVIKKLSYLMENEPLRKQFSQSALERSEHFNTDKTMKKWKDLFEEIAVH